MTSSYPACAHTNRPPLETSVDKDVAEEIGRNYRVIPIFGKGVQEYNYTKYVSLKSNEYLKCRWLEYKRHYQDRVFAPFTFLDIRDYHFHNCRNQLLPVQSIHTKTDFRHKLKPGPGVDFRGQMPIPQELLMKRGTSKHKVMPKVYPKAEVEHAKETDKNN